MNQLEQVRNKIDAQTSLVDLDVVNSKTMDTEIIKEQVMIKLFLSFFLKVNWDNKGKIILALW